MGQSLVLQPPQDSMLPEGSGRPPAVATRAHLSQIWSTVGAS